ncbi:MAG: cation:proton antiporter [Bacteroidales bacterium]|nr:cation:proton antiporter [Bacteroidales bacterium]
MIFSSIFSLPLEDPVIIFTLVLFIILLSPIVLRKLRIPSIIGLLLAGVIVGPNGLNLLLRDSSIVLFGTVGLLYIMFLAALEIDMGDFKKSSKRSFIFGVLTFIIPLGSGIVILYYFLDYSFTASLLIASMFSTHTLISYPIVRNLGISKDESVTVSVGGTIITDTAVLLLLAMIVASTDGNLDMEFWIHLTLSLTIFVLFILLIYPRVTRWFFRNIPESGTSQYVFVLSLVFLAGVLADLAGLEPIIGAFLAGLAINRLVPSNSALMNRIEFVGNAIFIPFFLISVGMLVDIKVIFSGSHALLITAVITLTAIVSKWVPAYISQKLFGYSVIQRRIIFGLSTSRAAATLAVILIGFSMGIVDETILNVTVLLILITTLISSFITEQAGRKLAIIESQRAPQLAVKPERILVPVANPKNVSRLIELAVYLKDPSLPEPIFPLSVIKDSENVEEQLQISNKEMVETLSIVNDIDVNIQPTTRVDLNISNGIIRAIKELFITTVVLGWNARITTRQWIFGSILDQLLDKMSQMILVCKITEPLNLFRHIVVVVPKAAQFETGFQNWALIIKRLANQLGTTIRIYTNTNDETAIKTSLGKLRPFVETSISTNDEYPDLPQMAASARNDTLYVFVSARKTTISYNHMLDDIPFLLSKHFTEQSFIVLYPQQSLKYSVESSLQLDDYSIFPLKRNLSFFSRLWRRRKKS